MKLLRLITPEEIGEIATKHNGGKFLSLTELVSERVEHNIYRDFTSARSIDLIHAEHQNKAKILPFKKPESNLPDEPELTEKIEDTEFVSLTDVAEKQLDKNINNNQKMEPIEHRDDENMSSFILIEKERLKRSQKTLKQKEILDLYQKNSHVDVEQIKGSNSNIDQGRDAGVLVNKKQY